jgi:FKBP-type peptidyl-prolyl cis-trans isomerase (trigger factor)
MKSTIKKISNINVEKEEVIKSLRVDRSIVEMHMKRLTELFKTDTPQQIGQKLQNIIIRDNLFNVIMEEVARNYEVTFDEAELKDVIKRLEPQFQGRDEKVITEIAKKVITKTLIFQEIAKE